MKNALMTVGGLFILSGTLGFRPVADFTMPSEVSHAERSQNPRYLPVLKPTPRNTSSEIRVIGVIQAINLKSSAINVNGTWVHVSTETMINATVTMMMGIDNLVVGTTVQVYASRNKEGLMTATRIDLLS